MYFSFSEWDIHCTSEINWKCNFDLENEALP